MSLGDVIARLAVNLSLETAAFEEGADAAEKRLAQSAKRFDQLGTKMIALGSKMSLAFTAPLAAMGKSVLGLANDAKGLQNAAKLAGETFDQFQRGAAAAKSVGVEYDKFGDILKDTQDKLGDFAANGGGEMQDFFENVAPKVGVTIDMFRELSGSQALQLYYDSLIKVGTPQQQMVFYMESIADEASALIPLLADNGRLMKEMGGNAAVLSASDAAELQKYTDAQSKLAQAFTNLQIVLANSGIVEAATAIVTKISELFNWFSELPRPLQQTAVALAAFTAVAGPLIVGLGAVISASSTLIAAFGAIGAAMISTGSVAGALTVGFAALRGAVIAVATAMGPWGIAIAAISAGLGYLFIKQSQADAAAKDLSASIDAQSAKYGRVRELQAQVAASTGQLTASQRAALTSTANLTGQAHLLAEAWARVAANQKQANLEGLLGDRNEAYRNVKKSRKAYEDKKSSYSGQTLALMGLGGMETASSRDHDAISKDAEKNAAEERQKYDDAIANGRDAQRAYETEARRKLETYKPEAAPKPYTLPDKAKPSAGGASKPSGPSMATAAQQQRELEQLAMEEMRAKLEMANSAEERAQISHDLLAAERQMRIQEIDSNESFTKEQKEAQKAYIERLYGTSQVNADGSIEVTPSLYGTKLGRQIAEEQLRQANEMMGMQAATLESMADIEPNTRERARLEREALELNQQIQRNLLVQEIATGQVANAEQARALLASQQSAQRTRLDRENMSPLERYKFDLQTSVANINDAMESIQVNTIESLTDGLAGAIAGTQKLGDVFKNVAQKIIADLIRIQIQKRLAGLLGSLFGGGQAIVGSASTNVIEIGGDLSRAGKFAVGTNHAPPGLAWVGERGRELVDFRGGERVYTNADSKALANGRSSMSVRVDPSPYFNVVVDHRASNVASPMAARAASAGSSGAQVAMARKGSRSIP